VLFEIEDVTVRMVWFRESQVRLVLLQFYSITTQVACAVVTVFPSLSEKSGGARLLPGAKAPLEASLPPL